MLLHLRDDHAAARLRRRAHDARASIHRLRRQQGFCRRTNYDQIFTAHGMIMIFFVAMPFVTGLMNFARGRCRSAPRRGLPVPEQLQLLDDRVRRHAGDGLAVHRRVLPGHWLAYPPLSGAAMSPGVGRGLLHLGPADRGIGHDLSGINLIATIVKMRAPGLTMMKLPIFVWSSLCTNILIVAAFPILTAVLVLLSLDRYLGMHFFTNDLGGNSMLYFNLIWIWGHPEVYILVLPAFGVFSEVTSTFCGKRLFGYTSMVLRAGGHHHPRYLVWLHHFFTMGSGADVNSFFGITTMIISIPTGRRSSTGCSRCTVAHPVRRADDVGGRVHRHLRHRRHDRRAARRAPADFVLHNSLFMIAHFHNVIIGGVLFGMFAGVTFWFPKAFGFKLDEFWGKMALGFWVTGFYVAFMPLYVLGLMGVTRRMQHFDDPSLQPWFIIAAIGALLIACGIGSQIMMFVVSIRRREELRDLTGDPWGGRTLEWSTSSPPPDYNFAFTPVVHDSDAWWGT